MNYFKAKYVGKSRFESEWTAAIDAYTQYLHDVLPELPESVQAFLLHQNRHDLHDMCVEPICRPAAGRLCVELSEWRLEFGGAGQTMVPAMEEPGSWLYDEIHLLPHHQFELCALIEDGANIVEFQVAANEIRMFSKELRRYTIPDEPAPPAPTLFLNRKHRPERRKKR